MSTALLADVPSTVTAALNQIDDESRAVEDQTSAKYAVGPFSVFRTAASPSIETPAASSSIETTISPSVETTFSGSMDTALTNSLPFADNEIGGTNNAHNLDAGGPLNSSHVSLGGPSSFNDLLSNSLDFLQWSDLFAWDTSLLDDSPGLPPFDPLQAQGCSLATTMDWQADVIVSSETQDHNSAVDLDSGHVAWPEVNLVMDAPLLLNHFNDQVIGQMGSLPINEKSPWRILNIPSAIVTMSHLTVLDMARNEIKHANLANFYALIAVSSFHLSLNPVSFPSLARPVRHWETLSERAYEAAKHHLHLSLEMESKLSRKAKYKDQLMAVAAILATSVRCAWAYDSTRRETNIHRTGSVWQRSRLSKIPYRNGTLDSYSRPHQTVHISSSTFTTQCVCLDAYRFREYTCHPRRNTPIDCCNCPIKFQLLQLRG